MVRIRHPKLSCLSCTLLLTVAAFILASLVLKFQVHLKAKYDITSKQDQLDEMQSRVFDTLDHFDAFLPEFESKFINFTINAEGEVGNRGGKVSESVSYSMTADVDFLRKLVPLFMHQLQLQTAPSFLLSEPIINDHTFSYIHNPHRTCADNPTHILITVPSATNNFENRQRVRNGSRGDYVRFGPNKAKLLFFLGRPPQNETYLDIQQQINDEAQKYGDIVQENFEDIYRNMRFKAVAMLKWASVFCSQAKYVIRSDDDVKVNVTRLVSALNRTREKYGDFILGRRRVHGHPKRQLSNKYYLSLREYPESTFPPYVLGGLLGYPMSTVKLLYQAALRMKPLWLDDAYITGLCALKVKVPVLQDTEFTFQHKKW